MQPYERVLVIVVPEAESIVGRLRDRHDPSASVGMPAHVTINYPLAQGREVSAEELAKLAELGAHTARFTFQLTAIRRFPNVLYLAPEPSAQFNAMIMAVASLFPDSPPYGGRHPQVIPHLTVAQIEDGAQLDAVQSELELAVRGRLPIACHATQLTLFDNPHGHWERREVFPLLAEAGDSGCEIITQRVLDAPRERVFQAFADPQHLARWWGPKGFTNTFHEFDFRPGGHWRFVMHGPERGNYVNESVFVTISAPGRIVFEHRSPPPYEATFTLGDQDGRTLLHWRMRFPSIAECDKVKRFAVPANEENLDRLEAELARMADVAAPAPLDIERSQ